MKKLLIVILLIATLMAIAACNSKAKHPETTANAFLTAMEKKDFENAKNLATPESEGMLELIGSFMSSMNEEEMGTFEHKILETVVEGDSARVSYEMWTTQSPDQRELQEIKLIKSDGKWKVSLEKGDIAK